MVNSVKKYHTNSKYGRTSQYAKTQGVSLVLPENETQISTVRRFPDLWVSNLIETAECKLISKYNKGNFSILQQVSSMKPRGK